MRQQAAGSRQQAAAAFAKASVVVVLAVGCSDTASPRPRAVSLRQESALSNDVAGMPPVPENAVEGFFQKVVGGTVVGVTTLPRLSSAPNNLADYLATGQPDASGWVYFDAAGAQSLDGVTVFRSFYIARAPFVVVPTAPDSPPVAPSAAPSSTISPALQAAVLADPSAVQSVYIKVKGSFTTKLGAPPMFGLAAMATPDEAAFQAARANALQARKDEASTLESSAISLAQSLGGARVHGFFTSAALMADLQGSAIATMAAHPNVVYVDLSGTTADDGTWDGTSMKSSGGLNGGVYTTNGFDGSKYATLTGGRKLVIATMGQKEIGSCETLA